MKSDTVPHIQSSQIHTFLLLYRSSHYNHYRHTIYASIFLLFR
nr:MAG TPA: hypothetical protein [Caudoviricetes sp.]